MSERRGRGSFLEVLMTKTDGHALKADFKAGLDQVGAQLEVLHAQVEGVREQMVTKAEFHEVLNDLTLKMLSAMLAWVGALVALIKLTP